MMVDLKRLRAHPDNKTKQAMQRDCEQAADELEVLRKDAERYRWLREREVEIRRYATVGQRASERLDDQIDAAIQEARAVGAA